MGITMENELQSWQAHALFFGKVQLINHPPLFFNQNVVS